MSPDVAAIKEGKTYTSALGYTITTPQQTLDLLHNPLGMLDSLMGIPSNAIGSLTTQIKQVLPSNVNFEMCGSLLNTGQISCQQQQQSPGASQTNTQVQQKSTTLLSPGAASQSPGAATSAPTTISPTLDLSALVNLFGSLMSKSPGASQEPPKGLLDQLGGIGTVLIIGAVALVAVFLFTSKK